MVRFSRKRRAAIEQSDAVVLPIIEQLKAEHPFWGYRRIRAYLTFVERQRINKKRVYRILRENGLVVCGNEKLEARRVSNQSKPRPDKPDNWWGIDMTKVLTEEDWSYLVIVNDWFTKKILGAFVGSRSRAADWLEAVNRAVCRQFPGGIREAENLELNLMSDNGTPPSSLTFMREGRALGIKQAFNAYANPKGNADTERLIRTIKEELWWLREWSSVDRLAIEMEKFVEYFNDNYLHSALGYKTLNAFENEWFKNNQITRSQSGTFLAPCLTKKLCQAIWKSVTARTRKNSDNTGRKEIYLKTICFQQLLKSKSGAEINSPNCLNLSVLNISCTRKYR